MPRNFSPGSESINHIVGVRMRLTGTGNLKMNLYGLDDIRSYEMKDLVMSSAPGLEPTRQCNFRSQRTQLEIKTIEMNDYFRIARIVIFSKPSATSYPM